MPGRLLIPQAASREAGKAMGVYKLTFPGSTAAGQESSVGSKASSGFRNAFDIGRRFHRGENRNAGPLPMSSSKTSFSSLEAPDVQHFGTISEDEEMFDHRISESVFTSSTCASTRTSNTISDDDSSLFLDFASRMSSASVDGDGNFAGAQPARHSTACCSDLAFRRELRKRFHAEPPSDDGGLPRGSTSSFGLGNSFRRELEKEDRVESLALWEETDHRLPPPVTPPSPTPYSWLAGDTAASSGSSSSRSKPAFDAILRKKKSSFFNGFLSGLSFSSSRRSRKSLS